jgi:PAS domain S-box-containing protein
MVASVASRVGGFIERKQAEDALRESELRYRSITEVSPEAIIGADAYGRIVSWNPGARTLFGYEAGEIIGEGLTRLMPDRFREAHSRGLDGLRNGTPARLLGQTLELTALRKDGSEFPVELSIGRWESRDGAFYSGIIRDVSTRKEAETALAAARDDAARTALQKAALLAAISHEMRTPLNAVVAMTGLLAQSNLDPERADWARTAATSAEVLMDIINDVLDFSKVEAGKLDLEQLPLDLGGMVRTATSMVRLESDRKGLALEVEIDPRLPLSPVGDAARIRQVLLNLLANAVKFTDAGHIGVGLSRDVPEEQAPTSPDGEAEGGDGSFLLRAEVVDTGVGMDAEQIARLFEPFAQAHSSTSRRYGGTGLGLSICRQLVTLMGGEIGVDSTPGVGSRFWFTVRLGTGDGAAPPGAAPPRMATPAPPVPAGVGRVLIVEDDEVTQKVATTLVGRLGYAVAVAGTGEAALAAMAVERFAAVFLDCHMPGLDGFATVRRLRALETESGLRPTPVIAMTGAAMPGDRERCLDAGMDDYVTKPVTSDQLGSVLERWTAPAANLPETAGPGVDTPAGSVDDEDPAADGIDWDHLAVLRQACGGDRGVPVLTELIHEYLAISIERLELLAAAVSDQRAGEVELVAHALKGSSATFGAGDVADLAGDIEQAVADGDLAGVATTLEALRLRFERAAVCLRQAYPAIDEVPAPA